MNYIKMPKFTDQNLELAVTGPMPAEKLDQYGWNIVSGSKVSSNVSSYIKYIKSSRAEWSIAKNGYVKSHSGWFSGRSGIYLALGRPVVIQDTGFSEWMHTGAGVIPFCTLEEAISGIEEINRRYEYHCRSAREASQEHFDANKVLKDLLNML